MKKKTMIIMLITCALVFNIVTTATAEIYPQAFLVIEVDYSNDIVIMIDFNGNEWIIEGVEDWIEGDIASAIMNDNDTLEIFDDSIISLRYSGYMWE